MLPAMQSLHGTSIEVGRSKQQKWAVPEMMQDEMFSSIPMEKKSMANGEKRYVIDLFAGGQSLKPVALKHNLGYIVVDLTNFDLESLLQVI
jgi:hypothetical protein